VVAENCPLMPVSVIFGLDRTLEFPPLYPIARPFFAPAEVFADTRRPFASALRSPIGQASPSPHCGKPDRPRLRHSRCQPLPAHHRSWRGISISSVPLTGRNSSCLSVVLPRWYHLIATVRVPLYQALLRIKSQLLCRERAQTVLRQTQSG